MTIKTTSQSREARAAIAAHCDLVNAIGWCACAECAPHYDAPARADGFSLAGAVARARVSYREIGETVADERFRSTREADPVFETSPIMLSVGGPHTAPGMTGFLAEATRAALANLSRSA